MEGRRRKTNIMIARSDAVSFWVEQPARMAAVEHGMAQKRLEETILTVGYDIGRGNSQWASVCNPLSLGPSVCLEPFLSSGFHNKTG